MPDQRQTRRVMVGTWNLAGRWSGRHASALQAADVDIWLLTEVPNRATLAGYTTHGSSDLMAPDRHWAAILARTSLPAHPWSEDPHPASAATDIDGHTFCSSILPWRSCGSGHPWSGRTCATKTEVATRNLTAVLPAGASVWGGDWNHALTGAEQAGSLAGRQHIRDALDRLELQCPTAELPHHISGLSTIDHVAVASTATVHHARRLSMATEGRRLSDHDAYIVDATLMTANGRWSVYVLDVEGLGPGHVYVG